MKIKQFGLILFIGILWIQQALRAENAQQDTTSQIIHSTEVDTEANKTVSIQTQTQNEGNADTIAEKDNPVAHASDLAQLQDLITNNERLTVATAWTINFSGFGTIGLKSTQLKNSAANPYLTLTTPGAGINLSGKLREDPVKDGDLTYNLGFLLSAAGGATTISFTNVNLKWDLLTTKQKEDPFYIVSSTIGQQLIPFGSDNLASEDKKPTISYAQYYSRIGGGRDIGILFDNGFWNTTDPINSITVPKLQLIVGLFNGAGANKIDTGNIKDKDLIVKATVNPVQSFTSLFGQLSISGTAWWKDLNWGTKDVDDPDKKKLLVPNKRFIGELSWLKKPLLITAEYLQYTKSPTVKPYKSKDTTGNSIVATVFWTPNALPNFQPLVRYDYFDPNLANNDTVNTITKIAKNKSDASEFITAGFNYFIYQVFPNSWRPYSIKETNRVIKLQFNYIWKIEQKNGKWTDNINNNELTAQAFFNF